MMTNTHTLIPSIVAVRNESSLVLVGCFDQVVWLMRTLFAFISEGSQFSLHYLFLLYTIRLSNPVGRTIGDKLVIVSQSL
ncbi:hypothetical protein RchiOBHm_Chr4g0397561 [Rosa chinensis]|uniref:Uncharacterized protein n=1 Tax=Rosa chinensis TaxID=74649 RepID=A0A2P6QS18_ROSCH|nr:hypothetical protein RchiOBHm_Chr4g0397561 [Rosa chinensis]